MSKLEIAVPQAHPSGWFDCSWAAKGRSSSTISSCHTHMIHFPLLSFCFKEDRIGEMVLT